MLACGVLQGKTKVSPGLTTTANVEDDIVGLGIQPLHYLRSQLWHKGGRILIGLGRVSCLAVTSSTLKREGRIPEKTSGLFCRTPWLGLLGSDSTLQVRVREQDNVPVSHGLDAIRGIYTLSLTQSTLSPPSPRVRGWGVAAPSRDIGRCRRTLLVFRDAILAIERGKVETSIIRRCWLTNSMLCDAPGALLPVAPTSPRSRHPRSSVAT